MNSENVVFKASFEYNVFYFKLANHILITELSIIVFLIELALRYLPLSLACTLLVLVKFIKSFSLIAFK